MITKVVFGAGILFAWAYGLAYADYRAQNCWYDVDQGVNRITVPRGDLLTYVFWPAGLVDPAATGLRYERSDMP